MSAKLPSPSVPDAQAPALRPRDGRSLTRHLLAWVLGALVLVWASFVAVGYKTGMHEADELTDGHLASVAHLLLRQHDGQFLAGGGEAAGREVPELKSHDYQQSMSVVIWDARGQVLTRTGEAPLPSFDTEEGFATVALGSPPATWRTFTRWDPADHGRKVMVLLSVRERDDLAEDIAEQVAEPGFWLLPVVALALGWAIRRGLLPLRDLSRDVAMLDVHEARPLSTQPHVEFKPVVDSINTLVARQHAALARERELSSELAHELRTPLASLRLHASLLRSARSDEERARALTHIEQDAERANHVVSHLLALARATRAQMAENAQPLDLPELASRVVGDYAQAALDSGHELALVSDGPWVMEGHAVLLELALRNLIDNALSHTPRGTVVEVQIDPQAGWLQVCDGGSLPVDTGATATDARTHRLSLGLGLGHRVVEKIATLHNARFEAATPPAGFKSCYRITFSPAAA